MKKLLALLLLFGIVGCTTNSNGGLWRGYILDSSDDVLLTRITNESSNYVVDKNFTIPEGFIFIKFSLLNNESSFLEAYISPRLFERRPVILGGVKKIKDDYGSHAFDSYWIQSAIRIFNICESYSDDICLLDEFNGKNYLKEALAFTCSEESIARYNNNSKMQEKILNAPRCLPIVKENEKNTRLALEESEKNMRLALEERKKYMRLALEKRKQDAFNKLYNTCLGYGFNEQNVIASCIQQEIFNEKKLAILKEQQLEQLASLNSQQTEEQEETNFWLQILEGVAEGLADPNTWENARQNAEIQRLKNACRRTRSC